MSQSFAYVDGYWIDRKRVVAIDVRAEAGLVIYLDSGHRITMDNAAWPVLAAELGITHAEALS